MNAVAGEERLEYLEFRGNASEYFRIWIVNLLLSIVTLGVYSAWAKVRKKKYFYRNTRLGGHHFDYHAEPVAILKGRLIAVPLFVLYLTSGYFFPRGQFAILFVIVLLLPWLLVRSRMFNLRNTSFRNLRFNFSRRYKSAYKIMVGYGLLTVVTFGLAFPLLVFKVREFLVNNTSFGQSGFRFSGEAMSFFMIYLAAFGLLIALMVVVLVPLSLVVVPLVTLLLEPSDATALAIGIFIGGATALVANATFYAYTQSRLTNYTFDHTVIERNTFGSSWRAHDLLGIYLTNTLAIVASAGFLIPWASIRLARYQLERINLANPDALNEFVGRAKDAESATGEEIADIFDFDIGF